ncbi:hypothetical protein [Sulfitobacter sp. JB4-11]|uniref:hypothetical protein n=1 Tax=Sulfitobacter rhodophyticola TaxID=3238304 RepID=UPI003D81B1C3
MTEFIPASDIVDDVLNRTGQALMNGEFAPFVAHFRLPQQIETIEGRQYVATPEDLRVLFASVRAFHRRLGINRIVRACIQAEYKGDDCVEGVFKALFFKGSTLVHSVETTFVVLYRNADIWQVGYNMYGISDHDAFGAALMHAPPTGEPGVTGREAEPLIPHQQAG